MTKLPIRKRIGNVPQFSGSVGAAVAEVEATNRLDWVFLREMELVTTRIPDPGFGGVTEVVSERSVINLRDDVTGTPNPEVEEQQRDDVLLLIGDQIMDPIERPNAGPDDVDIEDITVEDVVLEGTVAEEDPMEDPDKNE
ncbi:hypothetical protein AgCh_038168 [Apium graveolens]